MGTSVPAENVIAALIVLAGGATSRSLEQGVQGVEEWQQDEDRHFGTWQHDLRSSLCVLWFYDEDVRARCRGPETVLDDLSLAAAIPILLEYSIFFANDEGAYWTGPDFCELEDAMEIRETPFRRDEMKRFFSSPESSDPEQALSFLHKLGFDSDTFLRVSRSGSSS